MSVNERSLTQVMSGSIVQWGTVRYISEDGLVHVLPDGRDDVFLVCEILNTVYFDDPDRLIGGHVIFAPPPNDNALGCVLGVIGTVMHSVTETSDDSNKTIKGKSIEIIAEDKLVIQCGEGKITIGPDGTVIIRGQRVLSRAKGVNKVKGAAVQIN